MFDGVAGDGRHVQVARPPGLEVGVPLKDLQGVELDLCEPGLLEQLADAVGVRQ